MKMWMMMTAAKIHPTLPHDRAETVEARPTTKSRCVRGVLGTNLCAPSVTRHSICCTSWHCTLVRRLLRITWSSLKR